MVGDGPLRRRSKQPAVTNIQVETGVDDEGSAPSPDALGRLCTQPMRTSASSWPEAQACGLPVIALSRGGAVDIIRRGETEHLIDTQSIRRHSRSSPRVGNTAVGQRSLIARSAGVSREKPRRRYEASARDGRRVIRRAPAAQGPGFTCPFRHHPIATQRPRQTQNSRSWSELRPCVAGNRSGTASQRLGQRAPATAPIRLSPAPRCTKDATPAATGRELGEPVTVAKIVWSRPMPVPVSRVERVPRIWRTMIVPARIAGPRTPSRQASSAWSRDRCGWSRRPSCAPSRDSCYAQPSSDGLNADARQARQLPRRLRELRFGL